jgi:hypothetical protein
MYEQQRRAAMARQKTQARATPLVVEHDDSLNQKESESNERPVAPSTSARSSEHAHKT